VCAVERLWRRRRRSACACDREAAAEETGGVESGGDLESFAMKNETPLDGLLFIGSKLSAAVLNYIRC
jgi:hypothetical protein